MRRSLLPLLCGAALLATVPQQVRAHAIETDVHVHAPDGSHLPASAGAGRLQASVSREAIELHSQFSNGEPVRDAAVRLIPADGGHPIELGRTDSSGRLAFAVPHQAGREAELQVDGGPGHRDWVELPLAAVTAQQAARPKLLTPAPMLALVPLAALGMLGGVVATLRRRSRF